MVRSVVCMHIDPPLLKRSHAFYIARIVVNIAYQWGMYCVTWAKLWYFTLHLHHWVFDTWVLSHWRSRVATSKVDILYINRGLLRSSTLTKTLAFLFSTRALSKLSNVGDSLKPALGKTRIRDVLPASYFQPSGAKNRNLNRWEDEDIPTVPSTHIYPHEISRVSTFRPVM